jgi:hypothetical protein
MTQTLHNPIRHPTNPAAGNSSVFPRLAGTEVSEARRWIDRAIGMFIRRDPTQEAARNEACSRVVRDACLSLRLGRIGEAEAILRSIAACPPRHADWLNLMGVIYESHGDWRRARRFYGKAMRADRDFAPAKQNMRRWYELFTFGRTNLPVALGDE